MDQGISLWPKLIIEEGRSIDALAKNRPHHEPNNNIDTKAKFRSSKKLTCKGTLRQVFIRVHRLELQLVMSTQLCELLPHQPSLWFNILPSPFPCMSKYTVLIVHVYSVQGRGYGGLALRQINTCRKVPLQVNFFRWWHLALPSMSLMFLRFLWSLFLVLYTVVFVH
jgi:hypothetical protein